MLSVPHLVILFIIALLVFGPEKLPELARMLGKAMSEFRRVTTDVRRVVEDEMRDMEFKAREADLRKRETELAAEREKSIMPPGEAATTPAEIVSGAELPPAPLEQSAEEEAQRQNEYPVKGTVPTHRPNNEHADSPAGDATSPAPDSDEKPDVHVDRS